ncbi:hypothetical protein ACFLZC_00025 [Patescibacteria group bacterium]
MGNPPSLRLRRDAHNFIKIKILEIMAKGRNKPKKETRKPKKPKK